MVIKERTANGVESWENWAELSQFPSDLGFIQTLNEIEYGIFPLAFRAFLHQLLRYNVNVCLEKGSDDTGSAVFLQRDG